MVKKHHEEPYNGRINFGFQDLKTRFFFTLVGEPHTSQSGFF